MFLYFFVAFFLIVFILLDKGKGSEIGALSTGNEFLSPKSSSSFLNKLIVIFIILLLVINFSITFFSRDISVKHKPIVDLSYDNKK
ncbi:MAG TPA: preprotein translocase subunit SecG [Candidatus Azoamicus sp.]